MDYIDQIYATHYPKLSLPLLVVAGLIALVIYVVTVGIFRVMNIPKPKIKALACMTTVLYYYMVLMSTVFARAKGTKMDYNLQLFWSYRKAFAGDQGLAKEIVLNMVMFVPMGFLIIYVVDFTLTYLYKSASLKTVFRLSMVVGIACSFVIEFLQLFLRRGLFEFDDVFDNTLGFLIGAMIFMLIRRVFKNKHIACLIVTCILAFGLTGCSNSNKSSNTSTDEYVTTPSDAISVKELKEESQTWQQKEEGQDHLYALYSGILDGDYTYDWIMDLDGNILVHYSCYTVSAGAMSLDGESRECYFMLLDPLEDKVLKQVSLGDTYYFDRDVTIKEDGTIYAMDSGKCHLNVYDSDLNFVRSYEPEGDAMSLRMNHAATKMYYYDSKQKQFFEQDLQTEEERQILDGFTGVDGSIEILDVWNDQYLCIRYWDDNGDTINRALDIETGEERDLYKGDFEGITTTGEMALFRDWESENTVVAIKEDYDSEMKILLPNTGHTDDFELDCKNMLAIGSWSDNIREQGMATVDVYDLKTGATKNHLDYHFLDTTDDAFCNVYGVYMEKYNVVAIMMNGPHIKKMLIWDVENDKVPESYSELLNLSTASADLKSRAQEISEKYDVTIHVKENLPEKYQGVYQMESCDDDLANYVALTTLDEALAHYPDGMLSQLRQDKPDGLHIYFVDSIVKEEGEDLDAVDTAAGLANSAESTYYVALDVTDQGGISNNIYHEIMHIFTEYLAFTGHSLYVDWDAYNPEGFDYDYSYINHTSDTEGLYIYTYGQNVDDVYFIDVYSESYPTEDFSRIMEYAMSSDLFYRDIIAENPHLKAKLQRISDGLREAFDDSTWPEVTWWEENFQTGYVPVTIDDKLMDSDPNFWQGMEVIRKDAYDYCEDIEDVNLLLCQYFRSKRDKFVTKNWNMLAGSCDDEFIAMVEKDAQTPLTDLASQGHFYEPVAGERIELTHFFASLNLLIKSRQAKLHNDNTAMDAAIYDMGTWAGDCLELSAHILDTYSEKDLENMSEEQLYQVAADLLCSGGGYFSRDNMLADVDAFNITASMADSKQDLYQLIQDYYVELSDGNVDRFHLFLENRYGTSAGNVETLKTMTEQVLLSRDNAYIPSLRSSLGIDVKQEIHCRVMKAVADTFVTYLLEAGED